MTEADPASVIDKRGMTFLSFPVFKSFPTTFIP
jgi:hypothetical protein